MGVFATIVTALAAKAQDTGMVMIDATHLKTRRTASSLAVQKGGRGRLIGRTKGSPNSKLHVLADAKGRPIRMVLPAGQISPDAALPPAPQDREDVRPPQGLAQGRNPV